MPEREGWRWELRTMIGVAKSATRSREAPRVLAAATSRRNNRSPFGGGEIHHHASASTSAGRPSTHGRASSQPSGSAASTVRERTLGRGTIAAAHCGPLRRTRCRSSRSLRARGRSGLADRPAHVLDLRSDVRGWNAASDALFGFSSRTARDLPSRRGPAAQVGELSAVGALDGSGPAHQLSRNDR